MLVGLVLVPGVASGHEADPRIATTIDAVQPPLPDDVVVQVQAGLATQLVARNPGSTVLEVLGRQGRPFLRISQAGVFGDVRSEAFLTTSSPTGAAPDGTADGPPRWVRVSAGNSWGWYDHRLHPTAVRAPDDEQREARLGTFEVPLRYGEQPVTVRGSVRFRPLLGSFLVTAEPAPAGVQVQALPGRLPGLFLSVEPGTDVTVLGRDGELFLRVTDAGVEVNQNSRTHVEDRAARGQVAGPPSTTPAWRLVAPRARSYTWLDTRLRYPDELPPDEALRADGPTRLEQWTVPMRVGARPLALTGTISWVPEADAAARVGGAPVTPPGDRPLWPYVLGAGAVLGLVGTALLVRRRHRAQPNG